MRSELAYRRALSQMLASRNLISKTDASAITVDGIQTDANFVVASIDIVDDSAILRSVTTRGGTRIVANYEQQHQFELDESVFLYESTDDRLSL